MTSSTNPCLELPPLHYRQPSTPSMAIRGLRSSLNMDTPPMTGVSSSASTPTLIQTPAQPPSPLPITPSSNKRSFPHTADLLGAPSETTVMAESPSPVERAARVQRRLATRRAERAVETISHRRTSSRHIFDPEEEGRIAPRPLPSDYAPTHAVWDHLPAYEQPSQSTLPDWVTMPPRANLPLSAGWLDTTLGYQTRIDTQVNDSIQQTVDRRLPVDPHRDARMYPHRGEAYTPARLAALADSTREADNWRRLNAVAGPGGGQWGDIPSMDPILTHPYLRHPARTFAEDSLNRPLFDGHSPFPYRSYDSRAPSGGSSHVGGGSGFHSNQTHEERQETVRAIVRCVKRLPGASKHTAAAKTARKALWADCDRAERVCAVCHDDYLDDSHVSITPCDHMYHTDCFNTWLAQPDASTCPMCRRDLTALAIVQKMMAAIGTSEEEARLLWMSA